MFFVLISCQYIYFRSVTPASSTPASIRLSTPVNLSSPPPPTPQSRSKSRKRKKQQADEVDDALLARLEGIQKEKQDEEGSFCESIASQLRTFTNRQKAVAYVEINKLLLNIEFPSDPYITQSHPHTSSNQQPYQNPSQQIASQQFDSLQNTSNSNLYNF